MLTRHRNKLVAGAAALLAIGGGGAAVAATGVLSPKQESQAVVDDAAAQLGISADKLSAALKKALENRVDAAVEAGRLTEAQGNELKARIATGEVPLVGLGPGGLRHGGFFHFGDLDAAASYLGVTEAELRTALEGGKTLAEIAAGESKSVDGLVNALVDAAKQDLAQAVADGRLTDAQRDQIVAGLKEHIAARANGELGPGLRGPGPGFGPPPAMPDKASSGSSSSGSSAAAA